MARGRLAGWLHGWAGLSLHLARTTCLLGRRSRHLFLDVSVCTCLSVFSDVYLGGGEEEEMAVVGGVEVVGVDVEVVAG